MGNLNKPQTNKLSAIFGLLEKYSSEFVPHIETKDRSKILVISDFNKCFMDNNHIELLEHWGVEWNETESIWFINY